MSISLLFSSACATMVVPDSGLLWASQAGLACTLPFGDLFDRRDKLHANLEVAQLDSIEV